MPRRNKPTNHQRYQSLAPCARKRRFRSEAEALAALENADLSLNGPELKVYQCPYCNDWHLASVKR